MTKIKPIQSGKSTVIYSVPCPLGSQDSVLLTEFSFDKYANWIGSEQ